MGRPGALTVADVETIRHAWAAGGVQQTQLAERYGVTKTTVSHVVRGLIWQHAPGPIVAAGFRSGVPHHKRIPAVIGPCSVCGRTMVRARDYCEDGAGWRARGCVRFGGRGRCGSCGDAARRGASRRGVSEPRPALPDRVGPCVGCARPMVRRRVYNRSWRDWRDQGCVAVGSGQRCQGCSENARRGGPGRVVLLPAQPRTLPCPLPPAEVARLRAQVGLPAVLPWECAS